MLHTEQPGRWDPQKCPLGILHCHKLFRVSREPPWLGVFQSVSAPRWEPSVVCNTDLTIISLTNEKLTTFTAHHLEEEHPLTLGLKMRCVAVMCRLPKVTATLSSAVLLFSDCNLALKGWFFHTGYSWAPENLIKGEEECWNWVWNLSAQIFHVYHILPQLSGTDSAATTEFVA